VISIAKKLVLMQNTGFIIQINQARLSLNLCVLDEVYHYLFDVYKLFRLKNIFVCKVWKQKQFSSLTEVLVKWAYRQHLSFTHLDDNVNPTS